MSILDYVKSLVPRIGQNDVLEDLRLTEQELTSGVIPSYTSAFEQFKNTKFNSEEAKELSVIFSQNFKLHRTAPNNFISEITLLLPNLLENMKYVHEMSEKHLEKNIMKEGVTATNAFLLRSGELLSFATHFAVDVLGYVLAFETQKVTGKTLDSETMPSKFQIRKIFDGIGNFAKILSIYANDPKKFQKTFDSLPETIINEKTFESISSVYKPDALDPTVTLARNFTMNPIYHIRLAIADYQCERYRVFKDKKAMLELRLLNLKLLNQKEQDPSLEMDIIHTQRRIESLEAKIVRMEDSVK